MTALFPLGQLRVTPGARAAVDDKRMVAMLRRHVSGDFGNLDAEDKEANRAAIESGERILSAYPIDPAKPCRGFGENTIWIITEREHAHGLRSATTILLPEEY